MEMQQQQQEHKMASEMQQEKHQLGMKQMKEKASAQRDARAVAGVDKSSSNGSSKGSSPKERIEETKEQIVDPNSINDRDRFLKGMIWAFNEVLEAKPEIELEEPLDGESESE
jgi:hypothetical protein